MTSHSFASRRAWRFALAGTFLAAFGLGSALGGVANADGPIVPKTEKKGSVPPIAEPAVPRTEQQGSIPRPDTTNSLWCRGPFSLEGGLNPALSGTQAATAAGERGEQLQPGECALQKRALRTNEPKGVRFDFTDNDLRYMTGMVPVLAACAHDPNCVVKVRVGLEPRAGWWFAKRNVVVVTKPHPG